MVQYRRNCVPGGTYFFTLALADRRAEILVEYIEVLRGAFLRTLRRRPLVVDAIVVLPEHIHTVWTLPPGDADYAGRLRFLKSSFTHMLAKKGVGLTRNAKGEYGLWQRRCWEHTIRDEADMIRHVDYIHFNPVKHGLVERVGDWPYSSFHRFVQQGLCLPDWCGVESESGDWCYGE